MPAVLSPAFAEWVAPARGRRPEARWGEPGEEWIVTGSDVIWGVTTRGAAEGWLRVLRRDRGDQPQWELVGEQLTVERWLAMCLHEDVLRASRVPAGLRADVPDGVPSPAAAVVVDTDGDEATRVLLDGVAVAEFRRSPGDVYQSDIGVANALTHYARLSLPALLAELAGPAGMPQSLFRSHDQTWPLRRDLLRPWRRHRTRPWGLEEQRREAARLAARIDALVG